MAPSMAVASPLTALVATGCVVGTPLPDVTPVNDAAEDVPRRRRSS